MTRNYAARRHVRAKVIGAVGFAAVACTSALPAAASASPTLTPLCTITYPDPGHPTLPERSAVSTSSAGTGATTFTFHTLSTTQTPYSQYASVTWANLSTGRTGGGWDTRVETAISRGLFTVTLPVQTVGAGRIAVVASVSNTAANGWQSNLDCSAEYTAH
ncbi:hypothetical protein [Gordonia soli]|uniref:Uncharacterized protein n=1 Tax=Gordonia soli NBRC 108243 TaxID=1223545 RepID=M0QN94_9ACTN|nr:hypothetical protein [Gordonia soli]GAC69854.1 hypothetical protein GS4_28_01020 [Gordonia soli NBRC 108243]